MADYEHGSMNTTTQEKTFDGFMTWISRTAIVIVVILVLMAIFIR